MCWWLYNYRQIALHLLILFVTQACAYPSAEPSNVTLVVSLDTPEVRPIDLETIDQDNCGGSAEVANEVRKSRSVAHTLEVGTGFEVDASGQIGIAGTSVGLGAAVSSQLGYSYGSVDNVERAVVVKALAGTHMQHQIALQEIWETGNAKVIMSGNEHTVQFGFRDDFEVRLISSKDLGCPKIASTIVVSGSTLQETPQPATGVATTLKILKQANLRQGPGDYPIVDTVQPGRIFTVTGVISAYPDPNWWQIYYIGVDGKSQLLWVRDDLVLRLDNQIVAEVTDIPYTPFPTLTPTLTPEPPTPTATPTPTTPPLPSFSQGSRWCIERTGIPAASRYQVIIVTSLNDMTFNATYTGTDDLSIFTGSVDPSQHITLRQINERTGYEASHSGQWNPVTHKYEGTWDDNRPDYDDIYFYLYLEPCDRDHTKTGAHTLSWTITWAIEAQRRPRSSFTP